MFIANVVFFRPTRGGRNSPPQSGYHPQIRVGDQYTSCAIESLGAETVFEFDREHRVLLRLLFPERYAQAIPVGSAVSFYEGSHLVGNGIILDVQEGATR